GDGRYPALRTFLLDPTRCQTVRKALELFGSEEFGLAEQNCLLYLSTTALYHFCNENQSHFNFEKYLFTLHKELYQQFREKVSTMKLPQDRADELLSAAAGNIFFCSSMDTIAIRIVSEFAAELEHKIKINEMDFFVDIGVPFFWAVDDVLKKIEVKNSDGSLRDTINLLDVKPVDGRHPKK
ncbi:MAG: hypothetical protein JW795_12240, partial [Chitinivibrionales bacterium]|nr:hypothetical protein [Chitinivibrionales bacterium]